MPKMTNREKLIELESRQRRTADDIEAARQAVRQGYAALLSRLPVERWTERELKDVLEQGLRVGAPAALTALKALPSVG
jgi:hypothetical protein